MSCDFDRVPVVEVHKDNLKEVWPGLIHSIQSATFIALDTELSGLGNRRLLNAKDLDDRYHYMREVAKTRSIVSVGLSCFRILPSSTLRAEDQETPVPGKPADPAKLDLNVQTYNILVFCSEDYTVEPGSLTFLVNHGFDFNRQYSHGLPFHRGNDKDTDDVESPSIRGIFSEIVRRGAPLILHNAILDLVFLYQSLYASLPNTQQAFLADLHDMFPGGIYDTKYITDYKARIGASYLEFVFRKCQRDNVSSGKQGWSHVTAGFPEYTLPSGDVVQQACGLPEAAVPGEVLDMDALCLQYANHGWCPNGSDCPKSHDIDLILKTQMNAASAKHSKKRRRENKTPAPDENPPTPESTPPEGTLSEGTLELKPEKAESKPDKDTSNSMEDTASDSDTTRSVSSAGSHRAGFDAFMTGFIFAYFSAKYGKHSPGDTAITGEQLGMSDYHNRVYLVGKDIPLQILKSSFSKTSKDHRAKLKKLRSVTGV